MNPRQVVASLSISAVIVATSLVIVSGSDKPLDVAEKCDTPARLARDTDGGVAYVCGVIVDSGVNCDRTRAPYLCDNVFAYAPRKLIRSTHVRAPRNDGTCLIREPLVDGGWAAPRYFGDGNRFPRAWMVGVGCEEVAGVVDDVRDSDKPEAELVTGGGK